MGHGSVMVGDNHPYDVDGRCLAWALKCEAGHHAGWNEPHGSVMCWILDVYLCSYVEDLDAVSDFDKIVER